MSAGLQGVHRESREQKRARECDFFYPLRLQVNGVDMTGRSQEELVAMLRSTRQGESVSVVVARQDDLFLPRELVRASSSCIVSYNLPPAPPLLLAPPLFFLALPLPAASRHFPSTQLACVNTGSGRQKGNVPARVRRPLTCWALLSGQGQRSMDTL